MTLRIFSISLLLSCFSMALVAQTPETPVFRAGSGGADLRMMCNDQFAGTVRVDAAGFTGQSNDIDLPEIYLCFGDELQILHNGDAVLTDDPDPATQGGIGYAFYLNQPNVTATTRDEIFADPDFVKLPGSNPPQAVIYVDQLNGDALFQNTLSIDTDNDNIGDQSINDFFNNGDPTRLFFAPITFDFDAGGLAGYEDNGSCVNVNDAAAFSVVYLNPIRASNRIPANNAGSFVIGGGLPQFDGSNYADITIELDGNPGVTGTITSGSASDGSMVEFTVPQPGVYNITVSDGKSCSFTIQMNITTFDPLELSLSCAYGTNGNEVCLPLIVRNFDELVGMQFAFNWDPAVLDFSRVRNFNLQDLDASAFNEDGPGQLNFQWFVFDPAGTSVADDDAIAEVCFTVVGNPGSSTQITFNDLPNSPIEIVRTGNVVIGLDPSAGKVYVGDPPGVPLNVNNVSALACDPTQPGGSVTFTAQDGVPGGYQYQWENTTTGETGMGSIASSGTTETIFGLSAGDYSITVVDQGCGGVVVTETVPESNIGVNLDLNQPGCNGGTDGTVQAIVFDGSTRVNDPIGAGYSFQWQPPAASNTDLLDNVAAGNFRVTVTDPAGCTSEASATLSQPGEVIIDVAKVDESCNVGGDGSITLTITKDLVDITATSTYQWSDVPDDTNIRSGLSADVYDVVVTDANGCSNTASVTINVPTPPTVTSFDSTSVECVNDLTGALTVNVTPNSGTTITGYSWTGPNNFTGTGPSIDNLAPGKYFVEISASDGCIIIDSATLFAPSELMVVDVVVDNPTCPGDDNGSLSVQISGGTMPYLYKWSTGDSGTNFSTLPRITAGDYSVTVVDANECDSVIITEQLEDPAAISAQFTNVQPVSCFDGIPCDGQATVLASGGSSTSGIYDFIWESGETDIGATSSTAMQLCQGNTFVVISDGICGDTAFVDIQSPDRLLIDLPNTDIVPVSCNGGSDGSISLTPVGGTPAYTYLWQDGSTNSTISGLPEGTYFVEVTDANGCVAPFSLSISEPDVLVASIDSSNTMDVSCFGETDGVVAVQWEGGNGAGGETYTWSPDVSAVSTATNLGAGTYTIVVTDSKGCSDETSYEVTEPAAVTASIPDPPQPTCFGFQTQVSVFAAGGGVGGPYTFSVNGSPQQVIDATIPVFAGVDIPVSVFDAAGCSYDTTLIITEPAEIIVDLGEDVEVQLGDSITLDPEVFTTSTAIDSFIWTPTDQFFQCVGTECQMAKITPLSNVTYVLTVIDSDGCTNSDEITIDVDKRRNIFIPNAFAPEGVNQEFRPYAGAGVLRINSMNIFDRWGKLLYNVEDIAPNDQTTAWDGRYNGKHVNTGVYVYLIEVTFLDGITLLYRGDVTVIR